MISAVCLSFYHSVCHTSCIITAKVMSRFHWNLVLWLDLYTDRKNGLIFSGGPVPGTNRVPLFRFPHHCGIGDFRRFISIFHTFTGCFFTTLGEMTDADKILNPRHFGSVPALNPVNPEVWIRIADHYRLKLYALGEVCALRVQSSISSELPLTFTWPRLKFNQCYYWL